MDKPSDKTSTENAMSDKNIESLKKAFKEDNVQAHKCVDKADLADVLENAKFTHLGSHATYPGKEGEFVYMVASVGEDGSKPRTWGWVSTEKEAREAIAGNAGDMQEHFYKFALIEKVASGICCIDAEVIAWFRWNGKSRMGTDTPISPNKGSQ